MNIPRRVATWMLVTLVIGLAGPALRGQDVAIRYRWNKGDVLRYRVTTRSDVAMTGVPGVGTMTTNTVQVQVQKLTVEDVAADGAATLRMLFESVRMELTTPMGTTTYDSAAPNPQAAADPITDMLGRSLGSMMGESITMVITPNGAVRSVDGMTRIAEKLKKSLPAGLDPSQIGMDSMMTDEALRSSLQQTFGTLPDKPVKPGDSWKNDVTMKLPFGEMRGAGLVTFKGVESVNGRQLVHLALSTKLSASGGGAPAMMGPMTVTIESGTGEGDAFFDTAQGYLRKSNAMVSLPMTMVMTGPDGTPMKIQALNKTNVTLEMIEK